MRSMTPHLWYDTQAEEAAQLYTSVLPDSKITDVTVLKDTPGGDCPVVSFTLAGQPFQAISAGPIFTFTPAISFRINCSTEGEVDEIWNVLSKDGMAMMPLDSYPFSKRYGWCADRYGLSWQVMHNDEPFEQKIVPSFLFVRDVCGKTEEAVGFWASVFDNTKVGEISRYGPMTGPDDANNVQQVEFDLEGYRFSAMDSAHDHRFGFNEAVSIVVNCDTQAEIDDVWRKLTAVPDSEQCGWLKDRFGVSWQIVPRELDEMMQKADDATLARVVQAFLPMKKLDLETLRAAHSGVPG